MRTSSFVVSIAVLALTSLGLASSARAIVLDQVDTFQNAAVDGWGPDFAGVASVVPDAGPLGAGDYALQVTSHGDPTQGRVGSRSITLNRNQWTGDWTATGVGRIAFDARNPNPFPIELWIGIAGPGGAGSAGSGDVYASLMSAAIPAASDWSRFAIDVTATGFENATNHSFGTLETALAGVTELRIFNNVGRRTDPDFANNFIGDEVAATWYIDNITATAAVPEPTYNWLGWTAAAGLLSLRPGTSSRRQIGHGPNQPRLRWSAGFTQAATAGDGVNRPGSSSASFAMTAAGSAMRSG